MFILKGGYMKRHHMGHIWKHPDRRSRLILTANASVGWRTQCFPDEWATQVPSPSFLHSKSLHNTWHSEKILAIYDGFLHLENSGGETSPAHPLVNSESCHNRVANWTIRDNIRPVELTQYGKIPYWASSTGRIFSRIAQLRTLALQLLRFTRKYTLSRRIYSSIVNQ